MPSDQDVYLFREGTLANVHRMLGCHLAEPGPGAAFAVWAPNASAVSVMGDWNGWNPDAQQLSARPDGSGIWEGIADGVQQGHAYKYRIVTHDGSRRLDKADPVGFLCELPPATASRAWRLDYEWQDATWMSSRGANNGLNAPMAIYEAHLGSWRRKDGEFLNYRELAHAMADYLKRSGIHARRTHAHHRASVLRLVGLSNDGIFRAHGALRHPAGFDVLRRSPASTTASA